MTFLIGLIRSVNLDVATEATTESIHRGGRCCKIGWIFELVKMAFSIDAPLTLLHHEPMDRVDALSQV